MQYDQFIGQVQARARLASNGEAVAAVRSTLQTLGERLAGGAADKLAAELPQEIGEYLRNAPPVNLYGNSFGLSEFFERVSMGERKDLPIATYHARVVIEVLQEAVTPGAIDNILAQLPDEFAPLFQAGSTGEMERRR